jgi:hypothetical protein
MKSTLALLRTLGLSLAASAVLIGSTACEDSTTDVDPDTTFTVRVGSETFKVRATESIAVASLLTMKLNGTSRIVTGELVAGDGGFNSPYHWHLDPATVHVADISIEVCDGLPSHVENDLGYWIDTVGQYCPWDSHVVEAN